MNSFQLLRSTIVILVGVMVLSNTVPAQKPRRCGTERWDIKTLSDTAAKKVNVSVPEYQDIKYLVSHPSPITGKLLPRNRLSPFEFKTFTVKAVIVGYKLESDGDIHIVIADPENRQQTMVVEIPDPGCDGAKSSAYVGLYRSARAALVNLLGPPQRIYRRPDRDVLVFVTGVGFFDVVRGQAGAAANGFELHPVLSIVSAKN